MTGKPGAGGDRAHKLGRFFPQRPAAQAARLIERGGNRGVIQRGVRRDDSGDAVFFAGRDDLFELRERKVGRDFQQNGFARDLVFSVNDAQQLLERVVFLQASAGRACSANSR